MKDPLMKPMTGAAIAACFIITLDNLFRQGMFDVKKLDRMVYYEAIGEDPEGHGSLARAAGSSFGPWTT